MADRSSNGGYKYQQEDKQGLGIDKEESPQVQADKAGEYVRELLQEKVDMDAQKWPNALRLLDQEIQKTQVIGKPTRDQKYVDIYREKPIRVAVKVLVPVREHPKFNFVGKLLGPKGNSMKRLQEETMCKMAVLGRGSMKDRQKEEEYRTSLDPKYAHLTDDLHVEITALAPPAEAHARIAFALAEVRKYLIPDNNDNIRQEQMREMELTLGDEVIEERRPNNRGGGILRSAPVGRPMGNIGGPGGPSGPGGLPGPGGMRNSRNILPPPPPQAARGPITRPVPAKTKVFSILDRARVAMDQYGGNRYAGAERHYSSSAGEEMYPSSRYTTYEYEDEAAPHSTHDYYDAVEYPVLKNPQSMQFAEDTSSRAWKSYKTTTTSGSTGRYRAAPYARPTK